MDSEQSYRDNETTTKVNLLSWAYDLGVKQLQEISLGDAQFRCGGSKEYISWLENSLALSSIKPQNNNWRKKTSGEGYYSFEIVSDPMELDEKLLSHHHNGKSVRLAASYSRKWITEGKQNPHDLPPKDKDFYIPFQREGQELTWSRIWNYVPNNNDYSQFIQATPGSRMRDNPLNEVGCPYVLRGFDFDFLGVLWLDDLYWDIKNSRWMVNLDNVYETAWSLTLSRARKEYQKGMIGPETETVIKQLQRGYRILLSRAIHGVYVWFENNETRNYIESLL